MSVCLSACPSTFLFHMLKLVQTARGHGVGRDIGVGWDMNREWTDIVKDKKCS